MKFTTRLIGLTIVATLLAGSVAAQDYSLPDPDGLALPEESILGPSYAGEGIPYDSGMPAGESMPPAESMPATEESLPAPREMALPAPTETTRSMAPSRLINEPQSQSMSSVDGHSGPYDGSPDGYHGTGEPWHEAGPHDDPNGWPYDGWGGETAIPESSGTWLDRGVWFLEADAVALYRVWNRGSILLAAQDQNVESPFFNPANLLTNRAMWLTNSHPGEDAAVRATLGRFLLRDDCNRDHVAEFTFYGGGDWVNDIAMSSSSPNQLFTPFRVAGSQNRDFDLSSFQRYIYTSRFNSYEANYKVKQRLGRDRMVMDPNGNWRRMANDDCNRYFLAGLRFFELFETVDWTAEDIITNGTDGRYIVNVRNSLIGAQIGCGMSYNTGRWSTGFNTKTGLYLNDADSRSQLFFSDGTDNFDRFATEDELSFMAEVGVTGRYHIMPGFSLRAGLDLLFVESVALAPHQINFLPVYNNVTASGDPLYMGGSLGFECYW